jgi:hypothetical protein
MHFHDILDFFFLKNCYVSLKVIELPTATSSDDAG